MPSMDWKTIISELVDEGYTQPQIAAQCGCSQTAISELSTGKTAQPRFDTGHALQQLHKKAMRKRTRRLAQQAEPSAQEA